MNQPPQGRSTARLLESFVRQTVERLSAAALLEHGGETGHAREEALRSLLRSFLPPSLGVSTGFVIDGRGGRSRQIDIIIHFADYHAVFTVEGIPLVPVEAVITVLTVKSDASSKPVLRECYDNIRSVKALDRSNRGENVQLIDRERVVLRPHDWQHFQLQVFGAVLAIKSGSRNLWLDTSQEWCQENPVHVWPNLYCGVHDYIGTYRIQGDGGLAAVPDPTCAVEWIAFASDDQSPLAWATQEILNFVRVARRIDYLPTAYLNAGAIRSAQMTTRPLPPDASGNSSRQAVDPTGNG